MRYYKLEIWDNHLNLPIGSITSDDMLHITTNIQCYRAGIQNDLQLITIYNYPSLKEKYFGHDLNIEEGAYSINLYAGQKSDSIIDSMGWKSKDIMEKLIYTGIIYSVTQDISEFPTHKTHIKCTYFNYVDYKSKNPDEINQLIWGKNKSLTEFIEEYASRVGFNIIIPSEIKNIIKNNSGTDLSFEYPNNLQNPIEFINKWISDLENEENVYLTITGPKGGNYMVSIDETKTDPEIAKEILNNSLEETKKINNMYLLQVPVQTNINNIQIVTTLLPSINLLDIIELETDNINTSIMASLDSNVFYKNSLNKYNGKWKIIDLTYNLSFSSNSPTDWACVMNLLRLGS